MSTLTYEIVVKGKVVATTKTYDTAYQMAEKLKGHVRQVYKRVKETV